MDEDAVSSDPVLAFLLDEVVIKDWCARSFRNIVEELRDTYNRGQGDMNVKTCSLLKYLSHLSGIANVLETIESSFKGVHTTQLHDVHCLLENVQRLKQHLEIMIWCIRHDFLENIPSRYQDFASWHLIVHERKSAAAKRSWPNFRSFSAKESSGHGGPTLFIEDALANLGLENEEMGEDLLLTCLQKDGESTSQFVCMIGMPGCFYPFENFRVAADILFLHGSSDLVVAKRAISLYYFFDRHWTVPDADWRHLVDDFASTFGITRHSLLESLSFYLLDDNADQALQDACNLLPEIAGPDTHPKVAQVLLERQQPDSALMILRFCGYDGTHAYATGGDAQVASLAEAVTAVRVRIDCGLLTEAFMYQRAHCMNKKEQKSKPADSTACLDNFNTHTWLEHMEVLVTEVCRLCLRRNIVDRLIEFPWNSDEETFLHKCPDENAYEYPSTTAGSLFVVFYLQLCRYVEAYQIHQDLQNLENDFISKVISDDKKSRVRSTSQWRTTLVDRSLELLPEVQRQQVKCSLLLKKDHILRKEDNVQKAVDSSSEQSPNSESLIPSSYSLTPYQSVNTENLLSSKLIPGITDHKPSSVLYGRHLDSYGLSWYYTGNSEDLKSEKETSVFRNFPRISHATPLKELNQSAFRVTYHSELDSSSFSIQKVGEEPRGPIIYTENTYPANIHDDQTVSVSGKRRPSD